VCVKEDKFEDADDEEARFGPNCRAKVFRFHLISVPDANAIERKAGIALMKLSDERESERFVIEERTFVCHQDTYGKLHDSTHVQV
jgi:hypothetical protein